MHDELTAMWHVFPHSMGKTLHCCTGLPDTQLLGATQCYWTDCDQLLLRWWSSITLFSDRGKPYTYVAQRQHVLWIGKTRRRLFQRSAAVRARDIVVLVVVVWRRTVVIALWAEHALLVHFSRRLLTHVALVAAQSTDFLQQLKTPNINPASQHSSCVPYTVRRDAC